MAEYSLTLSALKYANVTNFSRPFGTKKTALQNSGSLTTEEFNIANALPFDIQRPLVITETSTISNIQYDAKVVINAASTTLTLESTGVTEGIMVTLMAAYDATIVFNNTSSATTISDVLHAGEIAKLVFIGGRWEVVQDLGEVKANPSDTKPFGVLIVDGSAYSKVKYPRLANFLGIRYNLSTDSSDVFRLPDLRNRTVMGANPDVAGKADGNTSNVGDVQKAQLPSFTAEIYLCGAGGGWYINPVYRTRGGVKSHFPLDSAGPRLIMDDTAKNRSEIELNPSYSSDGLQGSTDRLGDNAYTNRGEVRSANIRMNYIIKY